MFDIITAIAREILSAFLLNYLFIFLYVIIIVFIRMQYEKYCNLQGGFFEDQGRSLREITEKIVLVGLVTGFAGSFVIIAAGITIEADAVMYLFFIMCFLLIVNIRFLCIAYPAGILALVSLLFNYPKVNVSSILGLAAILHLIESLLIYLNNGRDSIPVFIKYKDDIAGAYLIRKFWPVPIVFFTIMMQNAINSSSALSISWWTLFRPDTLQTGAYALGLDCIVAVLCYSDLAITRQPEKKSRHTALLIFCYSIVLLILAMASMKIYWLKYAGAIFCIAVHEGITIYGRYMEKKGIPIFGPVRRGLKVMDFTPGSHAQRMGIQRGDIILSINGRDVQTEEGINEALKEYPSFTWIQLVGWDGKERTCEYKCYPGGYNTLGIIAVPREKEVTYNTDYFEHLSIIKNIVTRFKSMNKSL